MFAALTDDVSSLSVNSRVDAFIALAPIVYLANQSSTLLGLISKYGNLLVKALNTVGVSHIMDGECSMDAKDVIIKGEFCTLFSALCGDLLKLSDADPTFDNVDNFPTFLKHYPSGSSLRQFLHYRQFINMKSGAPVF